ASRAHTEAISGVVTEALAKAGVTLKDIDAIAVTYAPGLIGALLTGLSFAKGLAYSAGKPLVPVHHIRGHVAANYLVHPELEPPFYALVVSGGHTSLMKAVSYTGYELIGRARDDAAGEAFDKAARMLGLPYPGGAAMDKLASQGDPSSIKFTSATVHDAEYDFSFSGLKTAVINYVHTAEMRGVELDEKEKADIAASFTGALVHTIVTRLDKLLKENEKLPVVLAGGVAANSHLRLAVTELCARHGVKCFIPPLSLCGDNAAMIASQGYYEYLSGVRAPLSQNAYATKEV
ncbi:MAG: tRNA (adenosine(37)-N6)-threonylcarbamoyltransferase complex transferase subunit TsaD, partial [Clostridia bacterium]|nr:tRNA (adenosine(37)-N6)-threonylcarbamoyltransferase complex transferase subunit TsaD [Clostridia bacterium]